MTNLTSPKEKINLMIRHILNHRTNVIEGIIKGRLNAKKGSLSIKRNRKVSFSEKLNYII